MLNKQIHLLVAIILPSLCSTLMAFQVSENPKMVSENPKEDLVQVQAILSKYVEALGGEKRIKELNSFSVSGVRTPIQQTGLTASPGYGSAHWPTVKFDVKFKDGKYVNNSKHHWEHNGRKDDVAAGVIDGTTWYIRSNNDSKKPSMLEPLAKDRKVIISNMEWCGHPAFAILLQELSGSANILPEDQTPNSKWVGVRFHSDDGTYVDRFFNKDTGLLVMKKWFQKRKRNSTLEIEKSFEFQEQNGLKVLKRTVTNWNGRFHDELEFKRVDLNPISDAEFEIPDALKAATKGK